MKNAQKLSRVCKIEIHNNS